MTDLTPIVGAIITLLAAITTAFIIPLIMRNTTAKDREEFMAYVKIAVLAAEQLAKAGIIDPAGRKDHVLKWLSDRGFDIDLDEIEAIIDSIVVDLPPLVVKTKETKTLTKDT